MELRTFDGAVAIVTGGGNGIGRSLCIELGARGATVIVADLDGETARCVASEVVEGGGHATGVDLDVCDYEAVKALVDVTAKDHGRLDYLFNNAGVIRHGSCLYHTIEEWRQVLDVNLRGVVHGVHAVYPLMARQGFGHIGNMASVGGRIPWLGPAYTASKHAVVGLSFSLRAEAVLHGVRVTVMCPGGVRTGIFKGSTEKVDGVAEKFRQLMLRRLKLIDPEVFARIALNGVARNRAIVVAPFRTARSWWMYRHFPFMVIRLRMALSRRLAQKVKEEGGTLPPPPG